MKLVTTLLLLVLIASCTNKNKDSEQILREYISARFNNSMTTEKASDYLAKSLLEEVKSLSEEDSKKFFSELKISKSNFKVLSKNCNESKCFFTYVLSYKDATSGDASSVEVKKIAELHKLEDGWRIVDITNIKTHIDASSIVEEK